MTNDTLFEWPEYVEPNPVEWVPVVTVCKDCGEVSPNQMIHMINHSECWNGWCGKHLRFNSHALWAVNNPDRAEARDLDALEWIRQRGWEPCDPHATA